MQSKCHEASELWLAKSRAGYGSHGNIILTLAEAREDMNEIVDRYNKSTHRETEKEPYLLQRMIDPLLLLRGYKFSLRIYVVYFSSDEAYISSEGLVKLASVPLLLDNVNDEKRGERAPETSKNRILYRKLNGFRDSSMHMTNSGRETVTEQESLEYLWSEFDADSDKKKLWKDICGAAADTLMLRYPALKTSLDRDFDSNLLQQKRAWKSRREEWGIPKILGLDFVVDAANRKPWLVEVNRFPGLEPRDEKDRKIKFRVVRDAWKKASERLTVLVGGGGEYHTSFDHIFDSLSCGIGDNEKSSLQPLRT